MSIENRKRQVRRIRYATGIAWGVVVIVFIVAMTIEVATGPSQVTRTLAVSLPSLLVIALFLTVSWYVRSVALRFDSVQQALAAIQSRLDEQRPGSGGEKST